jgi:undecaprenyl diphosphate synthase
VILGRHIFLDFEYIESKLISLKGIISVSVNRETQSLKTWLGDQPNLPKHIGIIMDGNGRWAKKRRLPRIAGHNAGIDSVREVVEACGNVGIKVLTLFTFSLENWKRPLFEVSALMKLLVKTLNREIRELMEKNVRITCIGDLEDLPTETQLSMYEAIEMTKDNTGLTLNLALSYGSRKEIKTAVSKIVEKVMTGKITPDQIDEQLISDHLQTSGLPDPDLIIRTSGEFRISNFMLWQIAYSEIYVTNTLWPDFRTPDLYEAIRNYLKRERRFGMVTEQLYSQSSLQES